MSNFCIYVIFSVTIRARAMKLGLCIHLEELRSTLRSILSPDLLFYGSLTSVEVLRLGHFLGNYKG